MSVDDVLLTLVVHGLDMQPHELSETETARQRKLIEELLEDNDPTILIQAIRYGMPEVWPFSEGRVFDASDLRNNLLKAKASAGMKRRAGQIPTRVRTKGGEE